MSWDRFSGIALVAVVLFATTGLIAQIFPGRITGTVRNAQGAVVSGANVKLQNTSTGLERSVDTNENGEFNLPQLALGDRKSTRLNSSHTVISYAVFCLKKKKTKCYAPRPSGMAVRGRTRSRASL